MCTVLPEVENLLLKDEFVDAMPHYKIRYNGKSQIMLYNTKMFYKETYY